MKIFSWVMAGMLGAEAMETVEDRDAIIAEMEAEAIDLSKYHDFDNTTSADFEINYPKLVKEYFEGGANLVGGNVRGRSRAATAAGPIQRRSSKEDKEFIQRFLQLKYSILFLQQHKKNIGRYCFYGLDFLHLKIFKTIFRLLVLAKWLTRLGCWYRSTN